MGHHSANIIDVPLKVLLSNDVQVEIAIKMIK